MGYRRRRRRLAEMVLAAMAMAGCAGPNPKLSYLGDADLQYYKNSVMDVSYPAVCEQTPEQVLVTDPPRTITDRRKDEIRDLQLAEALHSALANNRIVRTNTPLLTSTSPLLTNPEALSSIWDPAIQETGVLFGGRGVEAALAAFDAQLTSTMTWGRDERVQNNPFSFAGLTPPGTTLTQETAAFDARLQKSMGYGGLFALTHQWDYLGTSSDSVLFPSSYAGSIGAEYRHPLWSGAGTEFTRIAGPITQAFGGITGVTQGVVIARINNDITIADFEAGVRDMLRDVEDAYWDLYLQYRLWDAAVAQRNSALRTWREARIKLDIGGAPNFQPADEAQALDFYHEAEAAAEAAYNQMLFSENNLRRLMGLPVNDGFILRPVTDPAIAEFVPDWHMSLAEALTYRVELRRQKFSIKSLELQHIAARKLVAPRLDFVSNYRVNGFGDRLLGDNDDDGVSAQGLRSAYETITQGDQTGWNAGFEFLLPIGLRQQHAQVRNIELRLARAREGLAMQEREVSHELAAAFQTLAAQHAIAQSSFARLLAARRRVYLFEAQLEAGTATLDLVLRAQASLAAAERAFYTAVVQYNQAITAYHYATGTLLEFNNVHLAEGPWTPEAYDQALRRAWARSYALENELLDTELDAFILPGPTTPPGIQSPPADVPLPEGAQLMEIPPMEVPPIVPPAPNGAPPAADPFEPQPQPERETPREVISAPFPEVTLETPEAPPPEAPPPEDLLPAGFDKWESASEPGTDEWIGLEGDPEFRLE